MPETEHFINEGFGWLCKRCRESGAAPASTGDTLPRFFREGEAEERETRLSSRGLARWRGSGGRRILFCPECATEETLV